MGRVKLGQVAVTHFVDAEVVLCRKWNAGALFGPVDVDPASGARNCLLELIAVWVLLAAEKISQFTKTFIHVVNSTGSVTPRAAAEQQGSPARRNRTGSPMNICCAASGATASSAARYGAVGQSGLPKSSLPSINQPSVFVPVNSPYRNGNST